MKEHVGVLRRVGLTLIIVGAIDIGIMIYCIANQMSYSSSFNIFAVVAGIFLMRGSLRAARIVSWFAAFFISGFIGVLLIGPWVFPPSLIVAYLKLRTNMIALSLVLAVVVIAFLLWTYRSLTSTPVRDSMEQGGIDYKSFWRNSSKGFWIGGCLAIVLFVFVSLFTHGETAEEAKRRAACQIGPGYEFHVNSVNISSGSRGKFVHAVVTAYNDKEIKHVEVEWSE